jgi:hypothetical protein
MRRSTTPATRSTAPPKSVYGRWSAVPVKASTSPLPSVPLEPLLVVSPRTAVGEVEDVVESSGSEVEDVEEVEDVSEVEEVDDVELDEVEEVDDVELEAVEEVDDVVVAADESVMTAVVPELTSFGSSATRIEQLFWLSQGKSLLGPSPLNTLNVSEPAPWLSEVEMTRVRKSQSWVGFTGFVLHCSIAGLKFGVSPVQDTVTC